MSTVGTDTGTEAVFRAGNLSIPRKLAVAVGAIVLLFIALNYAGIRMLMSLWDSDSNYGHGYLIPFIALYMVWTKTEKLVTKREKPLFLPPFPRSLSLSEVGTWLWDAVRFFFVGVPLRFMALLTSEMSEPCLWGLAIFLAGVPMWFLARPLSSPVLSGLAIVAMVNGLALYLGGRKAYRILWLPALYLIFMVPLPQQVYAAIANPLQRFASWAAAGILDGILGITTLRSGNVIQLAGHQLQVAEACSGMRSIMGLLALGVAFAYFWERSIWERVLLIISTIPIAIVANICRVTGTGVIYNMGHEKFAQGFYHEFTGWAVFIFAMSLFLLEVYILSHLFIYEHAHGEKATAPPDDLKGPDAGSSSDGEGKA